MPSGNWVIIPYLIKRVPMNKFLFFTKFLLSILLLTSTINAIELDWEHDYATALATAKKEHKMVYLFIGADQCRHCDRFKKQTLSNKALIAHMKKEYVLLYMSRDQHKIPDGYKKFGVPMHYFLTADGKTTAVAQGGRELDGWYDVLDEVDLAKED
jgi:thiol:disulfide interchange protein